MASRDVELGVGVLIVILALAALFLGGGAPTYTPPTGGETTTETQTGGTQTASSAAALEIGPTGFVPNAITLAAGQVTITVTNTDLRTHGFTLLEYNIDQLIPPEGTRTFTFTAARGTYTFSDTVTPSNTGTLTVQ